MTDEKAAIDALSASWPDLPVSSRSEPEAALRRLKGVLSQIQDTAQQQGDTHEGGAVLVGLADRAYWVCVAGIELLGGGNSHAWSICVRDLCEVFGAVSYLIDKPMNAPRFLDQGVSTENLRAAASRGYPPLRRYFRRLLCLALAPPWDLVLEASRTLYYRPRQCIIDAPGMTREEVIKGIQILAFLGKMIAVKLTELVTKHPDVISVGAVIRGK